MARTRTFAERSAAALKGAATRAANKARAAKRSAAAALGWVRRRAREAAEAAGTITRRARTAAEAALEAIRRPSPDPSVPIERTPLKDRDVAQVVREVERKRRGNRVKEAIPVPPPPPPPPPPPVEPENPGANMTAGMRRDAARGYLAGSEYRERVKRFISSVADEFDVSESDLYDLFYGYEESTYG